MTRSRPKTPTSAGEATALEQAPFCFALVDGGQRVTYANGSFRALLGDEACGQPLSELAGLAPELVDAAAEAAAGSTVLDLEVAQLGGSYLVNCFPSGDGAAVAFRDITSWVGDRRRGERLQQVAAELSGAPMIAEVTEIVLGHGRQALGAAAGGIALVGDDGETLEVVATAGYPADVTDAWRSFPVTLETPMGEAVRTRLPVFLEAGDPRRDTYSALPLPDEVSSATVPLIARDRVLGALTYRFADGQPLERAVRSFVAALGSQCAQAIDRALLFEAENGARLRAEQLADISARLAVAADPEQVTDITAEAGTQMLGAAAAAVVLVDGDRLRITSSRGFDSDMLERWSDLPLDTDMPLCECVRTGRAVFLDSRERATGRYPGLSEAAALHDAWGAVPLVSHGRRLGALGLSFTAAPPTAQRATIVTLASLCAQALERSLLTRRVASANERLEAAMDAGKMGWWEWDQSTDRVVWSDNLQRIYGLEPGQFGGRYEDFAALVHPDDRRPLADAVSEGLTGDGHAFEHRILTPAGELRWIDGRSRVARDHAGNPIGMSGIAVDVTERKLVELALRESDARFRGLYDSGVLGVSGGCGLAVDEANDALLELVGYDRDDLAAGRVSLDRLLADDRGPLDDSRWAALLAGGWLAPHEREYRRKDGTTVTVLFAAATIDAGSGRWIGYALDLSDRKRDEAALQFLADASEVLASSLDYEQTLQRLAELAVPHMADWCSVSVLEHGEIVNMAVAHTDPGKIELARTLQREYPPDPDATSGAAAVIRRGRTEFLPEIPDELLVAAAPDPQLLAILRDLGLRSVITAPLTARGRTFGALTLIAAESGRSYTARDVQLAEDLAHRAAMAIDNARLFRERSAIADTLQASLLPPLLPAVPGFQVAAEYVAGGDGVDVGGDFYDLFETGPGRWTVMIGDVCGKGAPAATLTSVARHTARAAAIRDDRPAAVLDSVNTALLGTEMGGQLRFCTAVAALLEPGAPSLLTLARAGHPPPLVRRASGAVDELGGDGTLLGVFEDPELRTVTATLEPGDMLVLYTDGVTDSWRDAGGHARLVEAIGSLPAATTAAEAAASIRRAAVEARRGAADDVAVLVLKAEVA